MIKAIFFDIGGVLINIHPDRTFEYISRSTGVKIEILKESFPENIHNEYEKGKISNKVATITKEHKFFTENTVCPTCTQSIEEDFRINKIDDAQTKAKELQSGYKELEQAIIGEYLHEAPRRNPQYAEMRDILQSLKTPEQLQHDVEMYFRDVEEYGEDRPFEQWNEVSRKDAFIRGYAVGQWEPEYYTDEQKSVIDTMMGLIKAEK